LNLICTIRWAVQPLFVIPDNEKEDHYGTQPSCSPYLCEALDPNLSSSEKKKKLKAVHSQTDPLVKSILNPTQYKQWEVIRKNEPAEMQ